MSCRMRVTSLMRSSITAAEITGQRGGVMETWLGMGTRASKRIPFMTRTQLRPLSVRPPPHGGRGWSSLGLQSRQPHKESFRSLSAICGKTAAFLDVSQAFAYTRKYQRGDANLLPQKGFDVFRPG